MICKYCGTEIPDNDKFCYSCGRKTEDSKITDLQRLGTDKNANTTIDASEGKSGAISSNAKKWYKQPWLYIVLVAIISAVVVLLTLITADNVASVPKEHKTQKSSENTELSISSERSELSISSERSEVSISFDSAELEGAVRKQLGIKDREITENDVAGVTEINLEGCRISGIEALAQFKNLTCLNLKSNKIIDLSPLAKLSNLTQLNLQNNNITDISALSSLCKLTGLELTGNKIIDISPLSEMTGLSNLSLDNNLINDVDALILLKGLKELDLSDNKVTSVEALSDLSCLESVNLNNNQIIDIEPLSNLTEIKEINLAYNQITDISALADCKCLTKLSLNHNPIEDISLVSQLNTLKSINIMGTKVKDISAVVGTIEIEMDPLEMIFVELMPGEYFYIKNLKLPINVGSAHITWTSSDDSIVTVKSDGKIQTTNVHPNAYTEDLYKCATLNGKIENVNADIVCLLEVSHDEYNQWWDDEKKLTYKSGGYKTTGYGYKIDPALNNVIGIDLDYEVEIIKGKLRKFTLRALVNGKWKNFGTIKVKKESEGIVHIDFGKKVKISRFWLVPKERKTGQWEYSLGFDTVYYALREADLGDLQIDAE